MLILKKVAVTGGLACGKSSVCRFFRELGAYVVSSDEIVHGLLSSDCEVGKKVIELLGMDILDSYQQINRSKIAQKVFNQPATLQLLENLLHPAVRVEIDKQYQLAKTSSSPLFIAEIPLFFESASPNPYDKSIAVIADPEECKNRFILKTGYDTEEFLKRSARQLPMEEKAKRADYVIINNGNMDELKSQVHEIFNKITNN